ncbi:MAG: FAD-dependent oxidoreductase [Saprospiraceae bacterium]|nr:FAD-dependent oxidoreductase [Saprospiraceae bacterium]
MKFNGQVITAEKIIINTGASPFIPKIRSLDQISSLTNRSILDLTTLPESLLIIGGGFIGVEFAQMFARFGSEVTILQKADRLVPGTDPEISKVLFKVFEKEKIRWP